MLYASAVATYNAPSDVHGVGSLSRERILQSVDSWRNGSEQRDCVFITYLIKIFGPHALIAATV